MKDYVVFDLENPNFRQNSICSIGLLVVRNNEVVQQIDMLINPEDTFDYFNIKLTGINPSMVVDKPTLKEYWPKISYLLTDNVVVGHNITYDLKVISKSLERYNMEVPEFDYCCTLSLARKNFKLKSNKLVNVADYLGIKYNPHIAIEDARASYEIFKHINSKKEITSSDCKHYKYKLKFKETFDPKLATNINNFYGMVYILKSYQSINNNHRELLKQWYDENNIYNEYIIFNNLNNKLFELMSKETITSTDMKYLFTRTPFIDNSSIYKKRTLQIQVLQGIIKVITVNNKVTIDELNYLYEWLIENNNLKDTYPYYKIKDIVESYLNKEVLSSEDEKNLSLLFKDLISPVKNTNENIELKNKTYCLSGDFKYGTKDEVETLLNEIGLIKKTCVSSKLDYLFVGDLGSPGWKYGNMGGKIVKANRIQDKGGKVKIISEKNLFKVINDDY